MKWDAELSGYAENPDNWTFLKIRYIGSLTFACCYLQYVPASKLFDDASFEVLKAIKICSTITVRKGLPEGPNRSGLLESRITSVRISGVVLYMTIK